MPKEKKKKKKEVISPTLNPQRFIVGGVDVGSQEAFNLAKKTQEVRPETKPKIAEAVKGKEEQALAARGVTPETIPTLEEAGAFEEVTPTEVPLKEELPTDIPVISPSLGAISQTLPEAEFPTAAKLAFPKQLLPLEFARKKGWLDKILPPKMKAGKAFPIPETPETLREAALREISRASFKKGVSRAEKFGTFMEAIPGIGALGRTWVGGLVEAPAANADEVLAEIKIIKEDASTGQEKVRNGLEDPGYGLDSARLMEEDIAELEGRLKLLISTSAILQANTDEVNRIQREILAARRKVARYRQASAFGLTAQMTGAGRTVPTDEQIFLELKELKGK